jgi:hypothetical protein
MTTSGLFRQGQAPGPAFFSVAVELVSHAREPERSIS